MLLAGCQVIPKTGPDTTTAPVDAPTDEPSADVLPTDETRHRIAILVPMSGRNGAVGESIANAANMAILDTSADNIRITTYDTSSGAAAAAAQAVADGNRLILDPREDGPAENPHHPQKNGRRPNSLNRSSSRRRGRTRRGGARRHPAYFVLEQYQRGSPRRLCDGPHSGTVDHTFGRLCSIARCCELCCAVAKWRLRGSRSQRPGQCLGRLWRASGADAALQSREQRCDRSGNPHAGGRRI